MTVSKYVAASLLGVAALSSSSQAMPTSVPKPPTTAESGAVCEVVSISDSSVSTEQAIATATATAAAFICGDGSDDAVAAATATASAFAIAIADVTATCAVAGDAAGQAHGYAKAAIEAPVWLEAYASSLALAIDCGGTCDAFAESFAVIGKDVFLSAMAETEAKVTAYSSDPLEKVQQVHNVKVDIEEAVVVAYANALASVRAVGDQQSCYAFGDSSGCVITETDTVCASCVVQSVSYSEITEIDAIARASAEADVWTCAPHQVTIAAATSTAIAIAEAHAIATSAVFAACATDEGGYACAAADTQVSDTAYAVAEAYARAWAGTLSCAGCAVGIDKAVADIGAILVEASSSAWASLCVDGQSWTVYDLQQHIESGYLAAIAEACALAITANPPEFCLAAVSAGAEVV